MKLLSRVDQTIQQADMQGFVLFILDVPDQTDWLNCLKMDRLY